MFRLEKFCMKKFRTDGWRTKIFHLLYIIYSACTQGHSTAKQEARVWSDHEGMEEFVRVCCIRGYMYHVYRDVWEAAVGEELACEREPHNTHDCYAVAVGHSNHLWGYGLRRRAHGIRWAVPYSSSFCSRVDRCDLTRACTSATWAWVIFRL